MKHTKEQANWEVHTLHAGLRLLRGASLTYSQALQFIELLDATEPPHVELRLLKYVKPCSYPVPSLGGVK